MKLERKIEKIYSLTPMQEGMLFHAVKDPEADFYCEQYMFTIKGSIDKDILERSFNFLIRRYDILRTLFVYDKIRRPRQVVVDNLSLEIQTEDISHLDIENRETYIEEFRLWDRSMGFDLTRELLMRVILFTTGSDSYTLLWSSHHITMDGWSSGILIKELLRVYRAFKEGEPVVLGEAIPFRNYVKWLEKQDSEEGLHYWKQYLEGYEYKASLPKTGSQVRGKKYELVEYEFTIEEELTADLTAIANNFQATVNILFQTLWGLILWKYNNTDDVVFGTIVSGRSSDIQGIENMIGLFINAIPLRIKGTGEQEFFQLLTEVRDRAVSLKSYEYLPLADIQANSLLKGDLIDHLMVFENYPFEELFSHSGEALDTGFRIENIRSFERANYDFNIIVMPGKSITIRFGFSPSVYEPEFVRAIEGHFRQSVKQVIADNTIRIDDIDILTEEEKRILLIEFNSSDTNYPRSKTIHQLFEEQAVRIECAVAAVDNKNNSITYKKLNDTADRLAQLLTSRGMRADTIVGMMMDRSIGMIAGILGILKAGGAYLPVDHHYPRKRIRFMLSDSSTTLLITTGTIIEEIEELRHWDGEKLFIEDFLNSPHFPGVLPSYCLSDQNLAYVIYTSGTSGIPKGVLIRHRGIINMIYSHRSIFSEAPGSRFSQVSGPGFDAMGFEVWPSLTSGAALYIVDDEIRANPTGMKEWLIRNGITISFQPTVLAEALLEEHWPQQGVALRFLRTAGDRLKKYPRRSYSFRLFNLYGPTEDSVWTTWTEVKETEANMYRYPTIGKPIHNHRIYILSSCLALQPVGVPGELCIAGDGLALGYLNNPELTNSKFQITNCNSLADGPSLSTPYSLPRTFRFYRTGDFARWLQNGSIEFLGRIDHQVNIRGFRIELGEIESQMIKHDGVEEAVVTTGETESGEKYLCAYYVAKSALREPLREYLSLYLPDYMIPSYFTRLERLPVTPNGKIDRKALPKPVIDAGDDYIAPANEVEKKLVDIWSGILNVDSGKISVNANFFRLGGHSLKATLLVSEIHKELNVKVPLAKIFETPWIRGLARYMGHVAENIYASVESVEKKEYYALSSAQKRLYILQQLEPESTGYNMSAVIPLEEDINVERLEQTFRKLIARHESLRTSFHMVDNLPVQKIHDVKTVASRWALDFGENEAGKGFEDFIKPFDLSQAPLLRVGLIKHTLFLDLHHIITDGTSQAVLAKEFRALYAGEELPLLRLQYKDYAEWRNSREQQEKINLQGHYWLNVFRGELSMMTLPIDFERPVVQSFKGASVRFALDQKETEALKRTARENDVTLYMILLAAFNVLLSKLSGGEDIIVGTPVAGRRHADLKNIVGMFLNTLAIRNYPSGEKSFSTFLGDVKTRTLDAYENQEYPFEYLVDRLSVTRDTGRNPIFDVMFNLLNQSDYTGGVAPEGTNSNEPHVPGTSKFDLNLSAVDYGSTLLFNLEYCTALFKKETVDRIIGYFKTVLKTVSGAPGRNISVIDILPQAERNAELSRFNEDLYVPVETGTIQERLLKSFQKNKDFIAVEYGAVKLSYSELNRRSTIIAQRLLARTVEKGSFIGIYLDNGVELVSIILGILKAGGAFVPLYTALPVKRVENMIRSTNIRLVITDTKNNNRLISECPSVSEDIETVCLEPSFYETNKTAVYLENNIDYCPEDKIYIYFTSGSTGIPNAVVGRNEGLLHFIKWEIDTFGIDFTFKFSQFINPGFDVFLRDIFVPLCAGGTICIPEDREVVLFTDKIGCWIEKYGIGFIHYVPSMFKILVAGDVNGNSFNGLRTVTLSGEKINHAHLAKWINVLGDRIRLVNIYGPTETTLAKVFHIITRDDVRGGRIPLGRTIRGARIIVLDRYMNPCARGVVGELYIRTPYRSHGYYNNPGLNRERFIPNPFNSDPDDLIYKTGDLGREWEDGNIEFVGRIDRQVKIRGIRIELGEIENLLLKNDDIRDSVVVMRETGIGEHALCAYIASKRELTVTGIREYLSRELPDYMIPSFFVFLDKLPLNPNGKIDRNALPEPAPMDTGSAYIAPRDAVESKLAEIWAGVLNVSNSSHLPIGIDANFFELGGHSLKATILISKVHEALDVQIPLTRVFKTPTIRGMSEYIKIGTAVGDRFVSIAPVEKKEYYPLSSAQYRLFILRRLDPRGTGYNMPRQVTLVGKLEKARLERSFRQLIRRHESFRTSFEEVDGVPVQRIHHAQTVEFSFQYHDFSRSGTAEDIDAVVQVFVAPFDLSQAPLLRLGLIKVAEEKHLLMLDMHHIISDGTSLGIFVSDLAAFYSGKELSRLTLQYRDFSEWQNQDRQRNRIRKQETFWLKQMEGNVPVLGLPYDYARSPVRNFEGSKVEFSITKAETEGLKTLALKEDVTLYMLLLGMFDVLLSKLSGQEDIIVGTPVAGRGHAHLQQIIGMFVNTLALRNRLSGELSFKAFLASLKENTLAAFENRDYPFEELVDRVDVSRDMSRNPLFDVMFALQNIDTAPVEIPGLTLIPYDVVYRIAKFDLTLTLAEVSGGLACTFEYAVGLFKRETIERYIYFYRNVVSSTLNNPGKAISEIEIVQDEERERLLFEFNNTETNYPREKTIHRLFEEQVEQVGDNIAVIGTTSISYRELDRGSERLAQYLRIKGVITDSIVGIMMERSVEMIIGTMGILKAGGAYLPIDSGYPADRIRYMLTDSSAEILLTTRHLSEKITFEMEIINIDNFKIVERSNVQLGNSGSQLAYVIYTSGTTGRPKGTLTTHTNVVRVVKTTNYIELTPKDRLLQLSNYAFDGSVFDIYGALLNGSALVMINEEDVLDLDKLGRFIEREAVSVFFVTTALFNTLVDERIENLTHIRKILFGGERVSVGHARKALEHLGPGKIVHMYGPTETTVYASYYPIEEIKDRQATIPIGKPLSNTTVFILDKSMTPVPIGIFGEVYVGGPGVARGYLNNPELTAERFNWFDRTCFSYRTGDLARWLADGNIEFSGRIDHQVKIRGFRIEMGEIEHQLSKHYAVKKAVVIAREDSGEKYLCAYLIADETEVVELREYLTGQLPDYMIPSHFVFVKEFPLNANGKVDQKALPLPQITTESNLTSPQNHVEEIFAAVWADVLGIEKEKIGIDSDFFQMGGHSLKAVTCISKLHRALNIKIPLARLFETPTIRKLARYVITGTEEIFLGIDETDRREYYELSPAQKRMYILQQVDSAGTGYNVSIAVLLEGVLNRDWLEQAFNRMIERHESLRTSFEMVSEEPVQIIHDNVEFEIEYSLFPGDFPLNILAENVITEFIRPFDLSHAPLLRVGLIETGRYRHIMVVDMHHIVTDGTSMQLLIKELTALYAGEELIPLRLQYKDFAKWLDSREQRERIKKQEEYWLKEFVGEIPVLDLPLNYERPAIRSFEGASVEFELSIQRTTALKRLAMDEGVTLYMILLAVTNVFLSKITNQQDIVVGTPVAGRRHADLERVIGMFVNTLALKNQIHGEQLFGDFLKVVGRKTLDAFENQEYPFEDLVERVIVHRDARRNPLIDFMLILQNMGAQTGGIPPMDTGDLKIKLLERVSRTAKMDLDLTVREARDRLGFSFNYCTRLFNEDTVKRFINYFMQIITTVIDQPGIPLAEIEILDDEEKRRLLVEFNDTDTDFPLTAIHRLFEEQAERAGDRTAVLSPGQLSLTYRELDEKSGRLAVVLVAGGLTPNTAAALMMDNPLDIAVGILGILKAGGAYLPLDPHYPDARIRYMLGDSSARILVRGGSEMNKISGDIQVIDLNTISTRSLLQSSYSSTPHDLAYIIYTSGTTGKPRGVMVNHSGLINYTCWRMRAYGFSESDVTLQLLSYCFDGFVSNFYPALLSGGKLVMISDSGKFDPAFIGKFPAQHKITNASLVPGMFEVLLDSIPPDSLERLRFVALAGEKASDALLEKIRERLPTTRVINEYGPTEATVAAAANTGLAQGVTAVIGTPIANTRVYILDRFLKPLPVGVSGELCVSGTGIARGYLNNPELTAERFSNGFNRANNIYKTGDRARWLPDGCIELLGRLDSQVKVRGFRVELSEIENRLQTHPAVKEVVVMDRRMSAGNMDIYLCAYMVANPGMAPGENLLPTNVELAAYLSRTLPGYMIPVSFIWLDCFPLTRNGKIDRNAFPEPDIMTGENYIAPRNEVEENLVHIWAGILGLENEVIGIDDDFFRLGGHSLKATILVRKIHKEFNVEISLGDIFKTSTIRGIASIIEAVELVGSRNKSSDEEVEEILL
jgi:tyrocidine synthetase-3